jgi:Predicted membrane protein
LPETLTFQPSKLGTYQLDYKVVAEKLDSHYDQQVRAIQQHALTNLQFKRNQVSGTITTPRSGILTSSIPYSIGWSVNVDGHRAKTVRTNQAFLGVWLPAGQHHVAFNYQTPGLKTGVKMSLIGLGWLLITAGVSCVWKRRQHQE